MKMYTLLERKIKEINNIFKINNNPKRYTISISTEEEEDSFTKKLESYANLRISTYNRNQYKEEGQVVEKIEGMTLLYETSVPVMEYPLSRAKELIADKVITDAIGFLLEGLTSAKEMEDEGEL